MYRTRFILNCQEPPRLLCSRNIQYPVTMESKLNYVAIFLPTGVNPRKTTPLQHNSKNLVRSRSASFQKFVISVGASKRQAADQQENAGNNRKLRTLHEKISYMPKNTDISSLKQLIKLEIANWGKQLETC